MPWWAPVLMLAGPALLGLARIAITIARMLGIGADRRPGYLDLRRRP